MRKRGHFCRPVPVCPSVTFVYCILTAEDINKLISRPGRPIILIFDANAPAHNSKGNKLPSEGH